jgi:hypothetical protein
MKQAAYSFKLYNVSHITLEHMINMLNIILLSTRMSRPSRLSVVWLYVKERSFTNVTLVLNFMARVVETLIFLYLRNQGMACCCMLCSLFN